jgi:hypothetical protein
LLYLTHKTDRRGIAGERQSTMTQTYAEKSDFPGLYYRPPIDSIGEPFEDLAAFDQGIRAIGQLEEIFEKLAAKGVHIPSAYGLGEDSNGNIIGMPAESWEQLIQRIGNDFLLLWCIFSAMLDPDSRDQQSLCCG